MTDDGQLLRQYVATHSEAAFSELVRRHLGLVYHAALRRLGGDAHAAQDVAQGVFILLARKAAFLCGHPSLAGWLYSAVNYETSSLMRSSRRRQVREREAGSLWESDGGETDGGDLSTVIDDALLSLSRSDREAVLLRYFEGKAFAEVAAKLGTSEAAAQKRVSRSLERMRAALARRKVVSTTAALAAAMEAQGALAAPAALAAAIPSAVAGATAQAGTGTLLLVQLMSTTKLSLAAVGLLVAAAFVGTAGIGISAYQYRQIARIEADTATAASAALASQDKLESLQASTSQAEKALAALKASAAAGGRSAAARARDSGAAGKSRAGAANPADATRFLTDNPQARVLAGRIARVQYAHSYDAFFKSSGMNQSEINAVLDLLVGHALDRMVLGSGTIVSDGSMPSDEELKTALGDGRFKQFKDFQQVLPAFNFADNAALVAGMAGTPLSADQRSQIVAILAKNSPPYDASNPLNLPAVDWEQVQTETQAILQPAQWAVVKTSFLQMRLAQQMLSELKDASANK